MKVNLRVERLVLDGVELTRRERAALGCTIERELRRQLTGERAARAVGADGRVDRIGREVAVAVHAAMPKRGRW